MPCVLYVWYFSSCGHGVLGLLRTFLPVSLRFMNPFWCLPVFGKNYALYNFKLNYILALSALKIMFILWWLWYIFDRNVGVELECRMTSSYRPVFSLYKLGNGDVWPTVYSGCCFRMNVAFEKYRDEISWFVRWGVDMINCTLWFV